MCSARNVFMSDDFWCCRGGLCGVLCRRQSTGCLLGMCPRGWARRSWPTLSRARGRVLSTLRCLRCVLWLGPYFRIYSMSSRFTNSEMLLHRMSMTQTATVTSSLLSIITTHAQTMPGRDMRHETSRLMGANWLLDGPNLRVQQTLHLQLLR